MYLVIDSEVKLLGGEKKAGVVVKASGFSYSEVNRHLFVQDAKIYRSEADFKNGEKPVTLDDANLEIPTEEYFKGITEAEGQSNIVKLGYERYKALLAQHGFNSTIIIEE